MSTLTTMKEAHERFGVYRPLGADILAELSVYATELERLQSTGDQLLREGFISTATGVGLSERERIFGRAQTGRPAAERRTMLSDRFSLGQNSFTLSALEQALSSMGLSCTISEYPHQHKLNIIAEGAYSDAEERFIRREIGRFVPAHIEWQAIFQALSWSTLDSRNRTFSQLDSDNLTWAQFDALR